MSKQRKIYYVVESAPGALGVTGTPSRLPGTFTSCAAATAAMRKYKRENTDRRIIYWTDFEWSAA